MEQDALKTRAAEPPLRALFFFPTFNAGETTRGVEAALALKEAARAHGRPLEIQFISGYSQVRNYEAQISAAGFDIKHTSRDLTEEEIASIMDADHKAREFVTDINRARTFIERNVNIIREVQPHLVVHGFLPNAGIAAQITGVPAVALLPFPPSKQWAQQSLLKDIPDDLETPLTQRLPGGLRRAFVALLSRLFTRQTFFTQPTFAAAGALCGWREPAPSLFTMLSSTVQIVADLQEYYEGQHIGDRCHLIGPLLPHSVQGEIPPRVLELLAPTRKNRVFVTMGSSGEKQYALEAIKAVSTGEFSAVVLVSPSTCSLEEARAAVHVPDQVYLTDQFLPADRINPLAQVAVIHGGQGTVLTALASSTPVIGVGMQAEQQGNLDNVVRQGAGIRIPRKFFSEARVREALHTVLSDSSYQDHASRLKERISRYNSRAEAGRIMWETLCAGEKASRG